MYVKEVQKETDDKIRAAKANYERDLEDKLCTSSTGSNIFWSAVNRLVDNKKNTNIPPFLKMMCLYRHFLRKRRSLMSILLVSAPLLITIAHFPFSLRRLCPHSLT